MSSVAPTVQLPSPLSPAELSRIAQDLQIRKVQVESVVQLLDEGYAIPMIARFRRERTHGLTEDVLRVISDRVQQIRNLADRKQTILKSLDTQGKLTDELRVAISGAETHRRLEDVYLPFKPKKKSSAADAREKGLEPFALALWNKDPAIANLSEILPTLLNPEKQVNTIEDVTAGARMIVAELIAETADLRSAVRKLLWDSASLVVTRSEKLPEGKGLEYKDYFQFTEPIGRVPPHRVLAINRGERENALTAKLEFDVSSLRSNVEAILPNFVDHPHREFLNDAFEDALTRLVIPALEREVRRELTDFALSHAVAVFARNLRGLLMQPPLRGKRILAIEPGFRTGCKLVALDESGTPLEDVTVFPHTPKNEVAAARKAIERLIRKYQTTVIAIGNGAASRETEEIVASLIAEFDARRHAPAVSPDAAVVESVPPASAAELSVHEPAEKPDAFEKAELEPQLHGDDNPSIDLPDDTTTAKADTPTAPAEQQPPAEPEPEYPEPPEDLVYVIVSAAGASDYASSQIGREEFPKLEPAVRGAISLGRRLQDPLSELVKIDPQHVGVGLYQHDIHGKHLKNSLEAVIESCVNHVGVDLNTAAVPLLRYVAGLNPFVALEIVEHRQKNGPYRRREQLTEVASIGPNRFAQAAGFLKIVGGEEPLDETWIHPESYELVRQILQDLGRSTADLRDPAGHAAMLQAFNGANVEELARKHHLGPQSIIDIFDALAQPGRDPREDLPPPVFRRDVLRLEDLKPEMELRGTVLNVVDFGAFVDIGLKDSGLVHISQLANRFIRNPHEIVTVGDVVTTWVMAVDGERHRVSLTMIKPGTERSAAERHPAESREQRPRRGEQSGRQQDSGDQGQRGPRPQRKGQQRRGDRGPRPQQPVGETAASAEPSGQQQQSAAQRQQRFERKPAKPKILPKLTADKREGKAYLNTLGELEAFFKARETPSAESPPPSE